MIPHKNNWRKRRTNKTWSLLQKTDGKDEQIRHDPSYKQQEEKTNTQDMIPPTNNWRKRRTNKTWSLLQTVVCRRDHVLFVRLFHQFFVGGIMSCLFVFSSRCLYEGSCLVCSSFPPVVCRRDHVFFVRLFHQLFVGGLMFCLFVFSSCCL
jgi:5-methylcytosine-specific restriction endonuclease McrA